MRRRELLDPRGNACHRPAGASCEHPAEPGSIVVCDDDLYVQGIITERDFIRILAEKGTAVLNQAVQLHMTKDVHTCTIHDNVDWLMEVMTQHRFRHLPVVENNRLAGIISIGDVVKQRLAIAELETNSMRQYIATG
jgi:signal-transduction protein with cAMP-binding, CBS, and nucleotidyltransferase domain